MMTFVSRTTAAALVALVLAGAALAQSTTPVPTTTPAPKATPAETKTAPADSKSSPADLKAARSAISKECSKQATAKGLRGKERRKFRSECKKAAAKPN